MTITTRVAPSIIEADAKKRINHRHNHRAAVTSVHADVSPHASSHGRQQRNLQPDSNYYFHAS